MCSFKILFFYLSFKPCVMQSCIVQYSRSAVLAVLEVAGNNSFYIKMAKKQKSKREQAEDNVLAF